VFSAFDVGDQPFALLFAVLHLVLMAIRIRFRAESNDYARPLLNREEGVANVVLRWAISAMLIGAIFAYFTRPVRWGWMFMPVPTGVRIAAVFGSALSLILLHAAHRALNREFSSTLRLQEGHRLVTWGPYRYIQHPIYVAFFVHFFCTGLYSRSWPIGLFGVAVISLLMTVRLRREERLLAAAFGDRYRSYREATPRFVPWPLPSR